MNILRVRTDPTLLKRLKEMLGHSDRADIAVSTFFLSGFDVVADELARLDTVRVPVGRTDRTALEEVALGLQQSKALRARSYSDSVVRSRQREEIEQRTVNRASGTPSSAAMLRRGLRVSLWCRGSAWRLS